MMRMFLIGVLLGASFTTGVVMAQQVQSVLLYVYEPTAPRAPTAITATDGRLNVQCQ